MSQFEEVLERELGFKTWGGQEKVKRQLVAAILRAHRVEVAAAYEQGVKIGNIKATTIYVLPKDEAKQVKSQLASYQKESSDE